MIRILIHTTLITSLLSCTNQSNESTSEPVALVAEENRIELSDAQLKNADLATGAMEKRLIKSKFTVHGVVEVPPQNLISVSVPMGGYLKSTPLLEGTPVRKGQVLAILEDAQYIQLQQDYLTAKARLAFMEKELERQKDLTQNNVSSGKLLQQTQADYLVEQATFRGLAERLRLIGLQPETLTEHAFSRTIQLHSPINGYVSKVNANVGKYIQPTDELFELVNPNDFHAVLTVFEKDIPNLQIGQPVSITVPNLSGKSFTARLVLFNRNLDANRSVSVNCQFTTATTGIMPGMFLNAEIEGNSSEKAVLPEAAVLRFENKNYVFLEKSKRNYEMLEVQTGRTADGFTEVMIPANLTSARFVTKNAYTLLMKLKNSAEEE